MAPLPAAERQAILARARDLFNSGEYWLAHEALETIWRSIIKDGDAEAARVWQGFVPAAGELLNTDLIEDYIGFESIKGWDLAQKMSEHARKFGAAIVTDTVERVRKAEDGWFDVATSRGMLYRAPAVILTAGGTPVKLGVPGEQEDAAKGVSYCAVWDGAVFKGEGLAVVGGGDAAVEEADYLTRYASKVYIVHRRDQLRASKVLQP